jgi:hypothetical protein
VDAEISKALLESLASLVAAIDAAPEMSDEDGLDFTDLAAQWLENASLPLAQLSPSNRHALADLCREHANEVSETSIRAAILQLSDGFGLDQLPGHRDYLSSVSLFGSNFAGIHILSANSQGGYVAMSWR